MRRLRGMASVVLVVGLLGVGWSIPASAAAHQARGAARPAQASEAEVQQRLDQRDASFRRSFGLQADLAYIQNLYLLDANHRLPGTSRAWGALLSSAEAAEMALRGKISEAVAPAPMGPPGSPASDLPFDAYLQAHLDDFAGKYIDQVGGGIVTVMFTKNIAAHQADLAALFQWPDHLRVIPALHTYAELQAAANRLAIDVAWLESTGMSIASLGPDVVNNDVALRVTQFRPEDQSVLAARYPGLPIHLELGQPTATTGEQQTEAPPMQAGLFMWRCDSNTCGNASGCTAGFIVTDGSHYADLTAGHCGSGGGSMWVQGPFFSGNYLVGITTSSVFGSGGDAEYIPLLTQSDQSKYIYISTISCGFLCTQHNRRIVGSQASSSSIGDPTCMSGAEENYESCGTVKNVNQCVQPTGGPLVCHEDEFSFLANYGDSGGPEYWPRTSGTSMAQGVVSLKFVSGNGGYFTEITPDLQSLGGGYHVYY